MNNKPTIRIFYTDLDQVYDLTKHFIYQILAEKYNIIFDEENPDYVIFSCFGNSNLQFDNAIKIFSSGENIGADFNFADYAIASEYLKFDDRYFRLPLWRLSLSTIAPPRTYSCYENIAKNKNKFCNFIYSNSSCAAPQRRIFFELLSQRYKQVDSGGRYLNNIGTAVTNKIAWQRDYKFSIAFENASQPGYSTEKIMDALKADTIPIYWGDPCIAKEINPKRFINVHDFDNFEAVIAEVKRLDQDDKAYINMLAEPWFIGTSPPPIEKDEAFRAWLFHIFAQDKEKARRITYYGYRKHYLANQCRIAKKMRDHMKRQAILRKIERPFKKLRNQFYKLCRKS